MSEFVGAAAADRLAGEPPGRLRAIAVAIAVGCAAAVAVYKLLRG